MELAEAIHRALLHTWVLKKMKWKQLAAKAKALDSFAIDRYMRLYIYIYILGISVIIGRSQGSNPNQ
jgi:hypothetical protein